MATKEEKLKVLNIEEHISLPDNYVDTLYKKYVPNKVAKKPIIEHKVSSS